MPGINENPPIKYRNIVISDRNIAATRIPNAHFMSFSVVTL
jgi:hypothetical protein